MATTTKKQSESIAAIENDPGAVLAKVIINGDLSHLTPVERVQYYNQVCESLGLNPLTQPFAYIKLNNKETLYAQKNCTDQLRKLHRVSIIKLARETTEGVYCVTASAQDKTGRTDESIGAVTIKGLGGEYLANAMMKAETKAKRRVTLSICGLGFLDQSEAEDIPGAVLSGPAPVVAPVVTMAEAIERKEQEDITKNQIVSSLEQRIASATTKDEFTELAAEIKRQPKTVQDDLRQPYLDARASAKKKALSSGTDTAEAQ